MSEFADFVGQDIGIGDQVIFVHGQYVEMHRGTVEGFTPQKVKILRYNRDTEFNSSHITAFPNQVLVIDKIFE